MLPLTHNAHSFVYLDDTLPTSPVERGENGSWILAPELAGRVALQADAALAVEASGSMAFEGWIHARINAASWRADSNDDKTSKHSRTAACFRDRSRERRNN